MEISIRFSNTNLALVRDFKKRIESLYDIKRRITIKKVKNKKDLYCYSATKNKIYEELMRYAHYDTGNWKLPVRLLDKRGLSLWLRAFFDSEGWVQFRPHQTRTIAMHSINHKGLVTIQKQLKDVFNIASVVNKERTRNISYLGIYGKENHIRFKNEIGFLHNEKRKKLKTIVSSYVVHKWQFPERRDELKRFIRNTVKKKARLKLGKDKPIYIRFFSIIEDNLQKLSKSLYDLYGIKSKTYRSVNGRGTVYYELSIQDIDSVKKMLKNNLLKKSIKKTLTLQNTYRA